jgi:hypothetical protein
LISFAFYDVFLALSARPWAEAVAAARGTRDEAAGPVVATREAREEAVRVLIVVEEVGPDRKCSPRHVIPFVSSNESLQCGG